VAGPAHDGRGLDPGGPGEAVALERPGGRRGRIVPPGSLSARPGLPAAAAAAFLLSAAFFAVDGFVPLMLTGVIGTSVAEAGAAAGVGMGIAFPTIPLAVMGEAAAGSESGELSSTLLMDTLGVAIGAGLGGSSVALAHTVGASLEVGVAGAFLLGLVSALLLLVVARRLPAGRATAEG